MVTSLPPFHAKVPSDFINHRHYLKPDDADVTNFSRPESRSRNGARSFFISSTGPRVLFFSAHGYVHPRLQFAGGGEGGKREHWETASAETNCVEHFEHLGRGIFRHWFATMCKSPVTRERIERNRRRRDSHGARDERKRERKRVSEANDNRPADRENE